jgi:hypothetical protein
MPIVQTVRIPESTVLEVQWFRLKQIPGVSPPEWEREIMVERYTAPPEAVWDARRRFEEEEKEKEEASHE